MDISHVYSLIEEHFKCYNVFPTSSQNQGDIRQARCVSVEYHFLSTRALGFNHVSFYITTFIG